jgi:hypothetical protein
VKAADPAELARIRRGLGLIFILAGIIQTATMVLATLYSLGKLPVVIGAGVWSQLYFAQFLFLVMGSVLYLGLSFKQAELFYFEALADFAVGTTLFILVLTVLAHLLVRRVVSPWWSLLDGLVLAGYGFFVRAGGLSGLIRSDASPKP